MTVGIGGTTTKWSVPGETLHFSESAKRVRLAPDANQGFFTSNLIVFRVPASFGISVVPAGNLLALNTYARMSAFCWPDNDPGEFCGIEIRIRSNRSPTVSPSQPARNSPPARGGAISPPVNSPPWHDEHCSAYSALP